MQELFVESGESRWTNDPFQNGVVHMRLFWRWDNNKVKNINFISSSLRNFRLIQVKRDHYRRLNQRINILFADRVYKGKNILQHKIYDIAILLEFCCFFFCRKFYMEMSQMKKNTLIKYLFKIKAIMCLQVRLFHIIHSITLACPMCKFRELCHINLHEVQRRRLTWENT